MWPPFIGDWALALEGPNGPGAFTLSVNMDKDKPSAELISEVMGTQPITDIAKADKSLALSYSFTWEGNAVGAVIKLTPAADGKTSAQIDFAGGAYVMTGTATKKETVKSRAVTLRSCPRRLRRARRFAPGTRRRHDDTT